MGRVLLETSPAFAEHEAWPGHPECPARLGAVLSGIRAAGVDDALAWVAPTAAGRVDLERVHEPGLLDALESFCDQGGGALDGDTGAARESWPAALLAAGAGLDAIARLDAGEADAAFCAVRPPGHHALADRAMGFCLLNNVAVAAAALADRGERVLVVDWDVHHGNGTQAAFYGDPRVAFVSLHQWPLYPGTGRRDETGEGDGTGWTVNVPLPAATTGDAYLAAVDDVIAPFAERFRPTWVLASAGFDGHRADPLAGLALSAGDYGLLAERVFALVQPGRRLAFLEGGYDLDALSDSAGACVAAMAGVAWRPEAPTSGGPGRQEVAGVALALKREWPQSR